MSSNKKDFLGVGVKFPLQVDPGTGRFVTTSAEEDIKQSIYVILMTAKSERLTVPDFGSRINKYVFEQMSLTTLTMMQNEIAATITQQEPRVANVIVDVYPRSKGSSQLIIDIRYLITETNQPSNMVFPFYLNNDEESENEWQNESETI